jgi:hypothetical protein
VQIDLTCDNGDGDFSAYEQISAQTEPGLSGLSEAAATMVDISTFKPTKKPKIAHVRASPSLPPPETRCPVCRTKINQQLFELYYTNGRRVRLATQFALCKAHKWQTARAE